MDKNHAGRSQPEQERIERLKQVRSAAWRRVISEAAIAVGLVALIVGIVVLFSQTCALGFLLGPGPITVQERYFRAMGGTSIQVFPGQEHMVSGNDILLGLRLRLARRCYCSDLYAEVHNYTTDRISGRWVEPAWGEGKLTPIKEDTTSLEGDWIRPPTGRYKVETWLKCASRPTETVFVSEFTTFILAEEKHP